jgi:hypothetical protein
MLPSYVPALPTGKGKCLGYKLHTTLYNFWLFLPDIFIYKVQITHKS